MHKETIFLVFQGLYGGENRQVTIVSPVDRRAFFSGDRNYRTCQKYYYEGSEKLVWARFISDIYEPPTYETGLAFVIAWFEGKFTRKSLYDLMNEVI